MSFQQWSTPRKVVTMMAFTVAAMTTLFIGATELMFRARMADTEEQLAERRRARFTDKDTTRILVVGDSFTAGELSQSKVGFWAYLPEALRQYGYHKDTEVISLAMAGTTSPWHFHQVATWLEETGQTPHYLFVITGANNNHSYAFQNHFLEKSGKADTAPTWLRLLYRLPRSWLWELDQVALLLGYATFDDPTKVTMRPLVRFWAENEAYMALTNQLTARWVGALHDLGRSRGFTTLAGSYVRTGYHDPLRALARRRSFKMYDIESEALEDCMRGWGFFTSDAWHPNDAGYKYLARRLARWLVSEVLPGPDGAPPSRAVAVWAAASAPALPVCTIAPRNYP